MVSIALRRREAYHNSRMPRACAALLLLSTLLCASCAASRGNRGPAAPGFTLTDDEGRPWTLSAQRGHDVLLTFGFTHCMDTCPTTLAKLARIAAAPGLRGQPIDIAFVTVDPRRDTPSAMHRFIARFGSRRIVGLTGSPAAIRSVERAYHVFARRMPAQRGRPGYDVAHTAAIFLIDPRGRIRFLRDDGDSQAALTRAVEELAG
jgi:protein SCO1/2